MADFKQYQHTQIAELRPYVAGEDISQISISQPDRDAGSPKPGDMIARNPANHDDQRLVSAAYFAANFSQTADPTSEQQQEAAIQAAGKTAPRVTPDHIDAQIESEQYVQPHSTALTICILTLKNGFHAVGHSAAASIENFDAEIGRTIAKAKAREQIWAHEGYVLCSKLEGLL